MMREQGMPIYKDVFYAALEACERLGLWREGQDVLRHVQVRCKYFSLSSQALSFKHINQIDDIASMFSTHSEMTLISIAVL